MQPTPDEPPLLSRETIYSPRFLDAFRDTLYTWTLGLYDPATGGFRFNDEFGVSPLASTDVIWMRYATNHPGLTAPDHAAVIAYLQAIQEPESGRVIFQNDPGNYGHVAAHDLFQLIRALNILGKPLLYPPRFLAPRLTIEGLIQWYDSFDWAATWRPGNTTAGNHHEVLGNVPILVSLNDPAWADVFFQKIHEQQDQTTGTWPVGKMNISRTFAYTVPHLANGRIPPMPERILDAIIDHQQEDGVWENPVARFHTMDAIYLLTRLPRYIGGYREADAHAGLVKASAALRERFIQQQAHYLNNPHSMLALTHSFGLLQEALPDEYLSERPYRFDWDVPAHYRSSHITPVMEAEA
jgi:hypothetical protein